ANDVIGRKLVLSAEETEAAMSAENFVNIRTIYGGTAPVETRRALQVERESETADEKWLTETLANLEKADQNLHSTVESFIKDSL
ncbi:MAG: hypothetical protein WA584_06045, partial [Pyrinomonadaceae bacterium]